MVQPHIPSDGRAAPVKEVLFVDCCVRREKSRTRRVARAFLDALDPARFRVTTVDPEREGMQPLLGEFFAAREELLERGELDHPRFRFARQFAGADLVVIAAPFWDLSFPAILKIYIENISVDGITFASTAEGLRGLCRGSHLIFFTTRGGYFDGSPLEQGSRYLEALKDFFGFGAYLCVAGDGLDAGDPGPVLERACREARALGQRLPD